LRTSLLKRAIGYEIFHDVGIDKPSWFDAYFHLQTTANLHDIYQWVTRPNFDLALLIPVPLLVTAALACVLVVRHGAKAVGLAVYAMAQIAALLAFGMRAETRDLLQLVPFLCLGGMLAAKIDPDAPQALGPREAWPRFSTHATKQP
jgi:hypothetical protein